jgi:23S rRNA (uracil1939-C5)-methyltransferase
VSFQRSFSSSRQRDQRAKERRLAPAPRTIRGEREEYRPRCPHYPACYGCPFLRFPYRQQLEKKREIVVNALAAYPALSALPVPLPLASPSQFGYRTRVKLAVRRVEGQVRIGLYVPETHQVVDISACPVHPEPVNHVVQFLKQAIERLDIIPYDEVHDTGQLRYIDLRYSSWQHTVLLTLVTRHMHFPQVRDLTHELERRFPFLSGIIQNIHDKPGNVIWGDRFYPLRGRDTLLERIGPFRICIPVNAFSQANPPVARKLYETALDWAGLNGEEIAVDLYCGIGPIALYLASRAKLVVGIDDNVGAINVAKGNARRNGYHNCRFFAGDAAEKLRETATNLARIDVIVANPPRKGLSPEAFTTLVATSVPRLIYVSCDPLTLARDLDRLSHAGYRVLRVQAFDMFPQTDQVETVALLEHSHEAVEVARPGNTVGTLEDLGAF